MIIHFNIEVDNTISSLDVLKLTEDIRALNGVVNVKRIGMSGVDTLHGYHRPGWQPYHELVIGQQP
jgi:hypothetical protein